MMVALKDFALVGWLAHRMDFPLAALLALHSASRSVASKAAQMAELMAVQRVAVMGHLWVVSMVAMKAAPMV